LDLPNENTKPATRTARLQDFLSLERNVTIASGAVFLLGFGEELWKKFLPKYLEALGASTPMIGLFGTAEDFFDAVYQYPGGWIADRFGRRHSANAMGSKSQSRVCALGLRHSIGLESGFLALV